MNNYADSSINILALSFSLSIFLLKLLRIHIRHTDVQAGFRKGKRTRDQIANIHWIMVEKAMAPHSSTLAWEIPWAEEPGGLQSMGS